MNSTASHLLTFGSAAMVLWSVKELAFPKKSKAEYSAEGKEKIHVDRVCQAWQPGAPNADFVITKPLEGVGDDIPFPPADEEVFAPVIPEIMKAKEPAEPEPASRQDLDVEPAAATVVQAEAVPIVQALPAEEQNLEPAPHQTEFGKFLNQDIQQFWSFQCASLQEPFRGIIQDTLRQYDHPEEQETPSVYRFPSQPKEHDNTLSKEAYNVLAAVFLWRHILDTGEEYVNGTPTKQRSGPLFCLGLIACLGHDIAKLRVYLKKYYATGDHAPGSANVMKGIINGRLDATTEKEVLDAIHKHHDKKHQETSTLTVMVMAADGRARERELRSAGSKMVSAPVEAVSLYDATKIEVPWFDAAEFIKVLSKYINVWVKNNQFGVSMRDGHVYFRTELVYKCFKDLANEKDAPEKLLYETAETGKFQLQIFIADELRKYGALAEDLVKPGYYSAQMKATWQLESEKKEARAMMVPIRAEAFQGLNLNQAERDKGPKLKRLLSLTPDWTPVQKPQAT